MENARLIKFTGSITLQGGTFSKLREVGLERTGGAADSWTVAEDRSQVDFVILTTSSFDGFDFTVSGEDAFVTFNLIMGKRKFPKRIFIGRDGQLCDYTPNRSLVSLTLDEFATIPRSIGIASGASKIAPVLSAMRGNHLDIIVTDEATGLQVLDLARKEAA